jgi:hypothetical protein
MDQNEIEQSLFGPRPELIGSLPLKVHHMECNASNDPLQSAIGWQGTGDIMELSGNLAQDIGLLLRIYGSSDSAQHERGSPPKLFDAQHGVSDISIGHAYLLRAGMGFHRALSRAR